MRRIVRRRIRLPGIGRGPRAGRLAPRPDGQRGRRQRRQRGPVGGRRWRVAAGGDHGQARRRLGLVGRDGAVRRTGARVAGHEGPRDVRGAGRARRVEHGTGRAGRPRDDPEPGADGKDQACEGGRDRGATAPGVRTGVDHRDRRGLRHDRRRGCLGGHRCRRRLRHRGRPDGRDGLARAHLDGGRQAGGPSREHRGRLAGEPASQVRPPAAAVLATPATPTGPPAGPVTGLGGRGAGRDWRAAMVATARRATRRSFQVRSRRPISPPPIVATTIATSRAPTVTGFGSSGMTLASVA